MREPNRVLGALAGGLGGLVGSWAMVRFSHVVGRLNEDETEVSGPIMHYLFGALMGATYGAAAETEPSTTAGAGVPFGMAVWLAAAEVGVPLVGFSAPPTRHALSRHAAAFGSPIVFGLTVEGVRRLFRGRFTGDQEVRRN
jgi:uncharacterized membrane protein YagU involved in acid resistance